MTVAKFAIMSGATLARARVAGLALEGSRRGRIKEGRRICEMNMFGVEMNFDVFFLLLCFNFNSSSVKFNQLYT